MIAFICSLSLFLLSLFFSVHVSFSFSLSPRAFVCWKEVSTAPDTALWKTFIKSVCDGGKFFCFLHSLPTLRSFFVDCFSDLMDDGEFACYCRWFDHLMKVDPPQLDLIGTCRVTEVRFTCDDHCPFFSDAVYLRTSPEVCYQRLQERGRKEEKPVTLVSCFVC